MDKKCEPVTFLHRKRLVPHIYIYDRQDQWGYDSVNTGTKNLSMKQDYTKSDLFTQTQPASVQALYQQYADKLLGYVLATLRSRPLAEDIIVKVFTKIFSNNGEQPAYGYTNTWSWLTALVVDEMNKLSSATDECRAVSDDNNYIQSNKYLSKMSDVQRLVFCGAYYHRKSITLLAKESGLPENDLRIALKQAFKIVRGAKDED